MASYKEVMGVLGEFYGADAEAIDGQFRARVQNFQRLGIPFGLQVGKGRRIDYDRPEIYQLVMCLELTELGITPAHVVVMMRLFWPGFLLEEFEKEWANPNSNDDVLFCLSMEIMSGSWRGLGRGQGKDALPVHKTVITRDSKLRELGISAILPEGERHAAILNITNISADIEKLLAGILPPYAPAER